MGLYTIAIDGTDWEIEVKRVLVEVKKNITILFHSVTMEANVAYSLL